MDIGYSNILFRKRRSNESCGRTCTSSKDYFNCLYIPLEDVVCRYGCIGKIVANRRDLNSKEASNFFSRMGIRLSLTTTYNPKANGKAGHSHSPIVKALVKACDGKIAKWPRLLPYALWADWTTHSSVTGFMPAELMPRQKPVMPVKQSMVSWAVLPWKKRWLEKIWSPLE